MGGGGTGSKYLGGSSRGKCLEVRGPGMVESPLWAPLKAEGWGRRGEGFGAKRFQRECNRRGNVVSGLKPRKSRSGVRQGQTRPF